MKKRMRCFTKCLICMVLAAQLALVGFFPLTVSAAEVEPSETAGDPETAALAGGNLSGTLTQEEIQSETQEETPELYGTSELSIFGETPKTESPSETESPEEPEDSVGEGSLSEETGLSDSALPELPILSSGNETMGLNLFFGTIGGIVWLDRNENGIADDGPDSLLSDITVVLYRNGTPVGGTVTNFGGYCFTSLAPGSYHVVFETVSNTGFTAKDTGNELIDSDAGANGTTDTIILGPCQFNLGVGCGYVDRTPSSIGDFVWLDTNENGVQDTGEAGLSGLTVTLKKCCGSLWETVASTVTDAQGQYLFSGLCPATYKVEFTLPAEGSLGYSGFAFTQKEAATGTTATDSNANLSGKTDAFALAPGENKTDIDAGVIANWGSIGNLVWKDVNQNGLQEAGEEGLPGVEVKLYCVSGDAKTLLSSKTTDANGNYCFTNLPHGCYAVEFITPSCFLPTIPDAGDDAIDSDAGANGFSPVITLSKDKIEDLSVDAGYVALLGSIGDYAWIDTNLNGLQDAGELPLAGMMVNLYAMDGSNKQLIKSTVTDASGKYLFSQLPLGEYQVQFLFSSGYAPTVANAGADDKDSDSDAQGYSPIILLNCENKDITSVDAGFVKVFCSIGDYVWLDTDKDGIQDENETGINGIKVELYVWTTQYQLVGTTATATNNGKPGWYGFNNLPDGLYRVKFIVDSSVYSFSPAGVGGNVTLDSDTDSSGNTPWVLHSTFSNKDDLSVDAGLIKKSTIPDTGGISPTIFYAAGGGLLTCGSIGMLSPILLNKKKKGRLTPVEQLPQAEDDQPA